MSTLATMKARITSELRRTNIASQIASAIQTAIEACEAERYTFNETREISFDTVADQDKYDSTDNAYLGRILKFDYVKSEIGATYYDLRQMKPKEIESLNSGGASNGQPLGWAWYNQQLWIHPVPADVYPIRVGALVTIAAPASDDEAGNPWMTTAERLIRCRAKFELYTHVLLDFDKAALFSPDNDEGPTGEAMRQLRRRTNNQTQIGGWDVVPTSF